LDQRLLVLHRQDGEESGETENDKLTK